MKIDIYKDNISYVTDEVSTVLTCEANLNEENRIKFITDLAAVSRGKDRSNNPEKRYQQLLKEAAPTEHSIESVRDIRDGTLTAKPKGSPSRPLEFLPVVINVEIYKNSITLFDNEYNEIVIPNKNYQMSLIDFLSLAKYSYMECDQTDYITCYTNMRALLNAGIPYHTIPYNTAEELKDFKAIKAQVPMFVWAQVPNTHTEISKEAQSDRVAENNNYWLPSDFRDRIYSKLENTKGLSFYEIKTFKKMLSFNNRDSLVNTLLDLSQTESKQLFKQLGYPREIYSRAMYYFKYKEVVMTGWYNDPKVWQHLFIERSAVPSIWKNWTQEETKQFVECIKQVIEN